MSKKNFSFKDWENSKFIKTAKYLGSKQYWHVMYRMEWDERVESNSKNYDLSNKIDKLNEEIKKLKEENYNLMKKLIESNISR